METKIKKYKEYDLKVPDSIIKAYQDYIDMEMDRGIRRGGNNYKRLVLEV